MAKTGTQTAVGERRLGGLGRLSGSERWVQFLFLLPGVVVLLTTSVYPLLYSFRISFFTWRMSRPGARPVFIGMENYVDLFKDETFLITVRNSIIYSISTVGVETVIGLLIALLLATDKILMRWVRSIVLIPMMITPVVVGLLWKVLFNYSYGLVNFFLELVGLPGQMWLAGPNTALFAAILVDIWEWTPMMILVMLAGLKSLPNDPKEAALVDGATPGQIFRYITLPLLRPVVAVVVLIRFMDSFKVFDTVWTLTQGGPGYATELITLFIYRTGLKFFNIGYAAAASWVLLTFIFILSMFFVRRVFSFER